MRLCLLEILLIGLFGWSDFCFYQYLHRWDGWQVPVHVINFDDNQSNNTGLGEFRYPDESVHFIYVPKKDSLLTIRQNLLDNVALDADERSNVALKIENDQIREVRPLWSGICRFLWAVVRGYFCFAILGMVFAVRLLRIQDRVCLNDIFLIMWRGCITPFWLHKVIPTMPLITIAPPIQPQISSPRDELNRELSRHGH